MNRASQHFFKLSAALGLALLSTAAIGQVTNNGQTPCEKTAKQMEHACKLDNREEYEVAKANCTNLSDDAARTECYTLAAAEKAENSELCGEQYEARVDACDLLGEYRYDPDPLADPAITFVHPDDIETADENPYVSLMAGFTTVFAEGDETIIVHVTDETKEIQGVPCRVVIDIAVEEDEGEYEPIEVTDDWFAQDSDRNVYYCGEISRNFEDGTLVDLDGSFTAGSESAKGGLLVKAFPAVGEAHRQEFALGEAEDIIQYLSLAAMPEVKNTSHPCFAAGGCLKTFDFTPLEPDATEYKFYVAGTGFVFGVALEDGVPTGETTELLCMGDSLDVLDDPSCGIADPDALRETLCALSPANLCHDGE